MANTYPRHLENQLVVLYGSYVDRLALAVTPPLTKEFEKENPELATDALKEELANLPEEVEKDDPTTRGAAVVIGAIVIPKFMFDGISRIMTDVDEWSFMRMRSQAIALQRVRKTTGLAEMIQERSSGTAEALLKSVKRNAGLIKNIRQEETLAISENIRQAVKGRLTKKELERNLIKAVGVTKSKAQFWARDQISKVQMDLNFVRLASAGFPAYKWNTSRDARVRPDHIWREGRVFTKGNSDILPGEAPNCRCTPGPAFGETDASTPTERRKTLSAINRDRRKVNSLKKNENRKPLEVLGQEALEVPPDVAA